MRMVQIKTQRILLVNSRGYYKFPVEIDAATNQDFYVKIVHKFMVFNLVLCDNHPSAETTYISLGY